MLGGAGVRRADGGVLPVRRAVVGAGDLIGGGWAGVVVAVIWAVIALILYAIGRGQLKEVEGAPQTVETLKEIPETLKRNEENR